MNGIPVIPDRNTTPFSSFNSGPMIDPVGNIMLSNINMKHMNPNPLNQTIDLKKNLVKPEDFIDHVKYLTLGKDFVQDVTEDGKVRLRINDPAFVKANRGLVLFTSSKDSPDKKQTLAVFNQLGGAVQAAGKKLNIDVNLPIAAVDTTDYENGGNILKDYFQIHAYPTLVYQDQDKNYHQFNGTNGLASAIKHACRDMDSAICNSINFDEYTHNEEKPLDGRTVQASFEFGM